MKLIILSKGVDLIPTIGIVLNTQKKESFTVVERVMNYLRKKKVKFLLEKRAAKVLGQKEKANYEKLRSKTDYIIIIGGDGTFLHTAHHFFGTEIPLLGINIGHLGFLTEIELNELETALGLLLKGDFVVEKRMILEANVKSDGELVYHNFALNDFVIHRGASSRLVTIDFFINNEIVNSYRGDGIIVATPAGSTAYSLSAGGPIVNPKIKAIITTPISPHSLFIRPMVVSDKEKIKIVIGSEDKMCFTADGSYEYTIRSNDVISIQVARKDLSLVKLPNKSFYSILHKKMKVGLV